METGNDRSELMTIAPHAILAVLWIGWAIYWIVSASTTAATRRKAGRITEILYRIPLILGIFLLAIGGLETSVSGRATAETYDVQNSIGLALVAGGLGFAIWARRHLGKFWSARITLKADHQVIQSGPYALVRHPIYSGLILALMGTALSLGTIQAFLGFVLLTVSFAWKLALEERWLSVHLGDAYIRYRTQVKALIPFVL
jgi:protein-S-isoprenylcysteine O-methyltransferase Ste14